MFYAAIQNDTLNTIAHATKEVAKQAKAFDNVTFDLSLIGSQGVVISLVGYVIVFIALLILFYSIAFLTKILNLNIKKLIQAKSKTEKTEVHSSSEISGEIATAIATALHLHFAEVHDFENTVLTIQKVQRTYSPWSSKIYGLRQYPNKITKSVEKQ